MDSPGEWSPIKFLFGEVDGISLPHSRPMFSLFSLSKIWKIHLSHQLQSKVWLLTFKALEGSKSKDVSRPQHPQRSCAKRPRSLGSEMLSSVWTSCLADPHGSGRWKTREGTKTSQQSSKCPQSGLKPQPIVQPIVLFYVYMCLPYHDNLGSSGRRTVIIPARCDETSAWWPLSELDAGAKIHRRKCE